MCGICGIVAPGRPPEHEAVARMSAAIRHRGPDGDGIHAGPGVAIASRRLAIIDLSAKGVQPLHSADGRLHLVYNGEIYNYRELRSELSARGHRFETETDTEVILAGYAEWGARCVEHFNGMWAFALWDDVDERLLCSRDRFGVKPFYYRYEDGRLSFASELKAFRDDPAATLRPNLPIVRDFVRNDWFDHTHETFFAGIRQLPPGHNLVLDRSGLRSERWWRLEPHAAPAGDAVEEFRELFLDAIRLRLRSDVRVGTCLSGGLDSSAVAGAIDLLLRTEAENARPVGDRQETFTAYFEVPGFDERPYARAVVERTNASPHWVSFGADELVGDLPAIVEAHDEPFRSTSICAGWYVMREAARAGVTVVLDGQGGDEVLGGYPAFFPARYGDLLARGRAQTLARELALYARIAGGRRAATAAVRATLPSSLEQRLREQRSEARALLHPSLRGLPPTVARTAPGFGDRFHALQARLLTVRGLPELLHAEDRNSMTHSIEARVPFLDYRIAELTVSLDPAELLQGAMTKSLLRRALADVLPPSVARRTDKLGFATPEATWFRGALGAFAHDVFASQAFRERELVDPTSVLRRLERHRRNELDAGFELWRALNLELWARSFLDA